MNEPPLKRSAPGSGKESQAQQNFGCITPYDAQRATQGLLRWYREAERTAREFHRTGSPKHLRAFCRHVSAILAEVERGLPQ